MQGYPESRRVPATCILHPWAGGERGSATPRAGPEVRSEANGAWDAGLMLPWSLATVRGGTVDESGSSSSPTLPS